MNKKILIGAFALMAIFGTSCDDHLDVNHDPNVLGELPDASVVLPTAELNLANTLMGWEFGFEGGFWSEYWTQTYDASQFKTLCQYETQSASYAYNNLTAGVLMDLSTIKEMTAESSNKGLYYISEALSIYTWQMIVDMWGDVPYTEAMQGDKGIVSPVFDDAETIYGDLETRIDALLAVDLSSSSVNGTYDVIFGGDLAKWKQFAASVKLKLMMRQSETSHYSAAATVSFIEANSFLTTKSCMIPASTWSNDQEGKRHPMMEYEKGGAGYLSQNVIACESFISYIATDPRLDVYFTATASDGHHEGAFFGDFESKEDTDGDGTSDKNEDYSQPSFDKTQDLMIMSAWEVNFFIAEAYARNGNSIQAKAYYEAGVKASLDENGISDYSILDAGKYAEWKNGTVDEEVKEIMMQKWVANCNYQHIESWLERNRTKYPEVWDRDIKVNRADAYSTYTDINGGYAGYLTISVVGRGVLSGKLPTQIIYPTSITQRNANAPTNRSTLIEGKAWWNQKSGL